MRHLSLKDLCLGLCWVGANSALVVFAESVGSHMFYIFEKFFSLLILNVPSFSVF